MTGQTGLLLGLMTGHIGLLILRTDLMTGRIGQITGYTVQIHIQMTGQTALMPDLQISALFDGLTGLMIDLTTGHTVWLTVLFAGLSDLNGLTYGLIPDLIGLNALMNGIYVRSGLMNKHIGQLPVVTDLMTGLPGLTNG
jgi:hypothetical protein